MNTFSKLIAITALAAITSLVGCKPRGAQSAVSGDAAQKTYVAPGKYDEVYDCVSGDITVSGRPGRRESGTHPITDYYRPSQRHLPGGG